MSCGCSISSEIHTGGVDHDVQGGTRSRTSADYSSPARDAEREHLFIVELQMNNIFFPLSTNGKHSECS